MSDKTLVVDNRTVEIGSQKNLLELLQSAGTDIPTFCYHSHLSSYGACRMCLVDIEGRGLQASCSITPEPGMKVRTNTSEIRSIRKIAMELILANHDQKCPTCPRNETCKLRELSAKLNVENVRFKKSVPEGEVDDSSPSLIRDPSKCILCGDCIRYCKEIQGISAIGFVNRGSQVKVVPTFGKKLNEVECVYCGGCASVCPTGAITPKSNLADVWKVLEDKSKVVVAHIAPAVRVAVGEMFGIETGTPLTEKVVGALKQIGFDKVFDTSFSADLTVLEEATEFIERKKTSKNLPQFTSCCPAWVKYAEQYYPNLLPNLSSCKSPQQMFGNVAKKFLAKEMNIPAENIYMISIMPCTAKKFEAQRPEFKTDDRPDVDYVLTTVELARMIEESGVNFHKVEPQSMDMPLGFASGAGVIFGSSGGVSEAVLRFAYEKITDTKLDKVDFTELRGEEGIREVSLDIGGLNLKLAIVSGLMNAKRLIHKIQNNEASYDLIEVMSCPSGCVGGAGQPVPKNLETVAARRAGLYRASKQHQIQTSQENMYIDNMYKELFGSSHSEESHHALHTCYSARKRVNDSCSACNGTCGTDKTKDITVNVCVGTSCFMRGSQEIFKSVLNFVNEKGLDNRIDVRATFCAEKCDKGPTVNINNEVFLGKSPAEILSVIESKL